MANLSVSPTPPTSFLGHYIDSATKERNIKYSAIGPFVIEYKGSYFDINWLENNYPQLLCSFNPEKVIDPNEVYTPCMENALTWIRLIKENHTNDLFLTNYHYKASCYPRLGE